jgi:hypothetical protein
MNENLACAQKSLKIKCVALREMKVYIKEDHYPDLLDLEALERQSFRSFEKIKELELAVEENQETSLWNYRFNYAVGIRLIDNEIEVDEDEKYSEDGEHVILEILGIFEASYLSQSELPEEQVLEFSKDNVGYHVWPYWRELVQSTCCRMGMKTPLEIPTYTICQDNE